MRIKRRQFLKHTAVSLAGACLGARAFSKTKDAMNVLFLAIDDLNTWLLSDPNRYTGKVIAPNILKLAESGVVFTQNFTPSPKCSPSRTAFLSGMAPWKSGVYENGLDISQSTALKKITSMPQFFKENGYYTASAGKIGHGYPLRKQSDACWHEKMKHSRDPKHPDAPLNGWAKNRKGKPTEKDWGPTHLPEDEMHDTQYADFAVRQLQKRHDTPFFIACGLFHPHFPWYVPQKYLDMYPLDTIALPEIDPDDLSDIPPAGIRLINKGLNRKIKEHNQVKQAIQGYLASTTYADAQIGRVLDALEKSPYKDNTIILLLTDHGFHLGEKQHWAKGTLWEEATHSLLMFRVPGLTAPGTQCHRPVTLLDIYPTLVELTALTPPGHLDGHSLVTLLKNPKAERAYPALTAFDRHMSVRTDRYRLIRYTDGTAELYDREKDPHEWVNQADNAEYVETKKRLLACLPKQEEMAPSMPRKKRKRKRDR